MKEKSILTAGLIFIILSTFSSCDINTRPMDKYSEDVIWGDPVTAQGFVNDAYGSMYWMVSNDDWSDNTVVNSSRGSVVTFISENFNSESDFGWNIYEDVRKFNKILEKVAASDFRESDKNILNGNAYFLRGMTYFAAARKFGRLMIVDKVMTPKDEMNLPRTKTIKKTYDFIISDLKNATKLLPADVKLGTPGKGAAYALLAEVCLHGAAYLDDQAQRNEYYAEAIKASEALFSMGKYSLDADFGGMFNTFAGATSSPEIILGIYRNSKNTVIMDTWMQELCPNMGGDKAAAGVLEKWPLDKPLEGWLERTPSQELTDAFLVVDKADGKAKKWNETAAYKNFRPNSGRQMHDAVYANRDQRFYATIVYDHSKYFTNTVTTRRGGNVHYASNVQQDRHMSKTGYLYRKGMYEDTWLYYNVPTNYCYPILRLGRSYLNYAEAQLRLNGAAGVSKAVEYINKTRTTHGKLPELASTISFKEAWDSYKLERRAELVQENDRYWSLLRWGKADNLDVIPELNTVVHAMEISENGESFEVIQLPTPVFSSNQRQFSKKRYLLPIPKSETIENSSLKNDQNPGWE